MAWNEPGGNNRDPWGGNNGRNQGPPDLDEIVRKLSNRFGGLFGGKRSGNSGGDGSGDGGSSGGNNLGGAFRAGSIGFWLILIVALGIWLASGFYVVEQGTRGVELRFGKFSSVTDPGLNYHLPYPIESRDIVDVEQRRSVEIGYRTGGSRQGSVRSMPNEALMLTRDENIVDIRLSVQYEISSPEDFLFNMRDPNQALVQVVESSIREVVGKSTMDFVLTEGRSTVVAEVKSLVQEILNEQYKSGLQITNVNLQDAQPPDEVQAAFEDAIKAREDEQRVINEADAYAREILPKAEGEQSRRLQEAEAYRQQAIAEAEGETQRFEKLLAEYQKAPDVTRQRLYLETMEYVLNGTNKVLLDVEGSNNLMYLPLDQLMNKNNRPNSALRTAPGSSLIGQIPNRATDDTNSGGRDTSRNRESR